MDRTALSPHFSWIFIFQSNLSLSLSFYMNLTTTITKTITASEMASTALTLTPPPHLQDLHRSSATSSFLSYRKPTKENLIFSAVTQTLSLSPLVLQCHRVSDNGRLSKSFAAAAAALATEAEVEEEAAELQLGDGGSSVAVATKPKKGKAALPLKRDRVCVGKVIFCFAP